MPIQPRTFRTYGPDDLDSLPQIAKLGRERIDRMKAVAAVLPFRVNSYVLDELINWDDVPGDRIFQLCFPQEGMLEPPDLARMVDLVRRHVPRRVIAHEARRIQDRLNPHPAGQRELNVPELKGEPVPGMQHKYRETVLFFPSQGQTCHAYCTYCFRWAQFVGAEEFVFADRQVERLRTYLVEHPEACDVLFTGGDPLVMRTSVLRRYIEPLLDDPALEHISAIRIGSKAPAWWPYRFLTDSDADDLLRLFEEVRAAGKHLALMAHYSHPRELSTEVAQAALRRIIDTGATVRCQAPLIRNVNDNHHAWAAMWQLQVRLGAVPYYMFVARDTGARSYFEVPLARAHHIFQKAYRRVSGLARTVRGPSMSASPGKVVIDGVPRIAGEKVFALRMLQARDPEWVGRPFYARYDSSATWLDDLQPAFDEPCFFFERDRGRGARLRAPSSWG